MDKKGIIDDILTEWAAECEDGMVGGHLTNNNIAALASVLENRGLTKEEVLEIIAPMLDEAAEKGPEDMEPPVDRINDDVSNLKRSISEKNYKPNAIADGLLNLLIQNKNDPSFIKFIESLNAVEGSEKDNAIIKAGKIYDSLDNKVKIELNNIHTGQKRSALGKGEIAFVWIIKGATHGGTGTGDIVLDNYKVDIKDYQGSINIERNSFDGFESIEFINELKDLMSRMNDPNVQKYVIGLMDKYKDELDEYAKKFRWVTGDSARDFTTYFIQSNDVGSFGVKARCGLNFIFDKISQIKTGEEGSIATLSVYKDGEKAEAVIDDKDLFTNEPIQQSLKNIQPVGKEIAINAKPMDEKSRQLESVVISKLKRAPYFKRTPKWDTSSMWANLANRLKYDGILLLKDGGNKFMDYIPRGENGSGFAKKFSFSGIQKGVTVKYKGSTPEK